MSVVDVVVETATRGELHHAIILHGPAADSLREIAVRIAKALNCLKGTSGDRCRACRRIDQRIHPDVHFIEVGGERKMISIEQIRELLEGASMRPYEGRNKVFIIDPADALSIAGSNSLLKTPEEPARDTTFLLLTRSPDLLLPTIRSRYDRCVADALVGAGRCHRAPGARGRDRRTRGREGCHRPARGDALRRRGAPVVVDPEGAPARRRRRRDGGNSLARRERRREDARGAGAGGTGEVGCELRVPSFGRAPPALVYSQPATRHQKKDPAFPRGLEIYWMEAARALSGVNWDR